MPAKSPMTGAIGKRIRKRRKELGFTQEQAAERCGLSPQFFACLERGIKSIRAESIIKISQGLNISADYILLGKLGEPERQGLLASLQSLDDTQSNFLETMVQNYISTCEANPIFREEENKNV